MRAGVDEQGAPALQDTPHVVLLTNAAVELTERRRNGLEARGIRIVDGRVSAVRTAADGTLLGVTHADGSRRDCDFVLVSPRTHPLRHLLDALGARVNDEPDAECILVPSDDSGLTSVPGVWVTGNVRDGNAQVIDTAAQGLKAAIAINAALVKETVDAAEADAG